MEVKTTFTIDLAPYLEGLKSMLTMTQQTGVQLKPLLNLQIGKADFSQLEKTFSSYNEKVKAMVPLSTEAAQASTALSGAAEVEEKKVRKSSQSHEEHALTLRTARRDALQAFGAIAFLTQGIVTLASSNDQGNKKLEKLNQGLNQGISSGFGLAGILITLGVTTMGVGAAIGAAVAVGVTLLKFLDDGTDKTDALERATKGYSDTLRGASLQSLQEYRANLLKLIDTTREKIAVDEEAMRTMGQNTVLGAKTIDELKSMRLALTTHIEELKQLDAELTAKQKTHAEWREIIRGLEISNIVNNYDRQRAEAQKHYEDQFNEMVRAAATAKAGNAIIIALKSELAQKLNEIDKAEQQDRIARITAFNDKEKQIDDAEFEEKLSFLKISGMRLGLVQGEIDAQVNAATLSRKRAQLAVELGFTDQADEDRKLRVANLLKEIAALQAQGDQAEIAAAKQKKESLDKLSEAAAEKQRANLEALNSIAQNLSSAFGQIAQMEQQRTSKEIGEEKKRKEATLNTEKEKRLATAKTSEERQKIEDEFAAAKTALDEEMDEKAKERNAAAFERQKAANIAQAMIATYASAALVLGPPPYGVGGILGAFLVGAIIASGLAQVAMIESQEIPGMAGGGRLKKGQAGYFEGYHDEIVAPEKSFIQVFKDDLAPRLIDVMLPQIKASVLASASAGLNGQGGGGIVQQFYFTIPIQNFYGDDEQFDRLKLLIEDAMRRAGVSSAAMLFKNQKRISP